jgi:Mg2+ and Co2+ transporter CorA
VQIKRAKTEATAHHYEEVKLFTEEIYTINKVLQDQKDLFGQILEERESSRQMIIDKRLERRIASHLDETIERFKTIGEYATQAKDWVSFLMVAEPQLRVIETDRSLWQTKQSIEVHGEHNTKALYVFTAVTVIFLPLTFISGVLGMNTADVRTMQQGKWLFWAISIPTTFLALLICLCILYFKFKPRRSFRKMFFWPVPWLWGRRSRTPKVREKFGEV